MPIAASATAKPVPRWCAATMPIISRAKQRSKRAMSEIARVERAARAEGKTYGCYVALHEPRKG